MKFQFHFCFIALSLFDYSFELPNCDLLVNYDMKNLTGKDAVWKFEANNVIPLPNVTSNVNCTYHFAFCQSMSFVPNEKDKTCDNVGGCLACKTANGIEIYKSLGKYETSSVSADEAGIKFKYPGGISLKSVSCDLTTVINLECDANATWQNDKELSNPNLSFQVLPNNCTLLLTVPYAGACYNSNRSDNGGGDGDGNEAKSHGLSPGSILLIIFFVGLLIYLIGGMSYNFTTGAHGVELIPHYEFWREIPGYVADGATFFFKFITCRSTQNDSYDSI